MKIFRLKKDFMDAVNKIIENSLRLLLFYGKSANDAYLIKYSVITIGINPIQEIGIST